MSSRPLLASVAESMVIFGPMDHVGWARASSTLTDSRSAAERFLNGPPEAVSTTESSVSRARRFEALEDCRVLAVDREQQPSAPLPRCNCEFSGRDEALLVREREGHAAFERPEGGSDPGEPDDRVQHEVGLRRLEELREITADLDVLDASFARELVQRL